MNELINAAPQTIPAIYQWGIEVIKTVQLISNPYLTEAVKIFTDVSTYGFAVLVPLIYIWCIDYKKGLHLFYVLTFGTGISDGIKFILKVPRPYTYVPQIMLKTESSFSTPSGHSFTGALIYPSVLLYGKDIQLKTKSKVILAILFPFLIGLSRIYLGVHYPTDVLAGWLLGGIIFTVFILFVDRIEKCISEFSKSFSKFSSKNIKSVKFAAAAIFVFIIILINRETSDMAGALFGLAFGNIYIYEPLQINFDASNGTFIKKLVRFILGVLCSSIPILVFYFAGMNSNHPQFRLYTFLEFSTAGTIVSGIMPIIFLKLKLEN